MSRWRTTTWKHCRRQYAAAHYAFVAEHRYGSCQQPVDVVGGICNSPIPEYREFCRQEGPRSPKAPNLSAFTYGYEMLASYPGDRGHQDGNLNAVERWGPMSSALAVSAESICHRFVEVGSGSRTVAQGEGKKFWGLRVRRPASSNSSPLPGSRNGPDQLPRQKRG